MRDRECRHPANGLLPWYVNGSLPSPELAWVREHVGSCGSCADECDELARSPAEIVALTASPARGPTGSRRLRYILVSALILPAVAGLVWVYAGWAGAAAGAARGLTPALLMDLGNGPTRAAEPLEQVRIGAGIDAVVISFVVPLAPEARYSFDLEGPHGEVLVRQQAIESLDESGRCAFAFPAGLLGSPGYYAILVRVQNPGGEVRLHPFPFEVAEAAPAGPSAASP